MERPTKDHPLLILAMDHRGSFEKMFGVEDEQPTPDQLVAMRRVKHLIYVGVQGVADQVHGAQVGVLVDEELGESVLREAKAARLVLAMPVEKSGQKLFGLQYGDDTAAHIDIYDPDYVKVLVRMNPADDPDDTSAQLRDLASLSALLHDLGRNFLYELLVPATDEQESDAGGTQAYDKDVRPGLAVQVIAANQLAGVEPTLWKIEGLETTAAAEQVVAAAKANGRDADCIVLGRDAPQEALDRWLSVAAPVDGFVGFAVGRSIWEEALEKHLSDGDDDAFTQTVGRNYLHYVRTYLDAR